MTNCHNEELSCPGASSPREILLTDSVKKLSVLDIHGKSLFFVARLNEGGKMPVFIKKVLSCEFF